MIGYIVATLRMDLSMSKKEIRSSFRKEVFKRDKYRCRVCGICGLDRQGGEEHLKYHDIHDAPELDAHHITPRELMPNGGYVKENGISVCTSCHIKAEDELCGIIHIYDYSPTYLYELIGSSFELAYKKSEKLDA